MKTLELKLKKDVLIVDLPIDAKNVYMSGNSIIYNSDKSCIVKPINDDYEFICKGSELTEEIASELVDYWQNMANDGFIYENYKDNLPKKLTANDALISAVESKEKFWLENPIQNTKPTDDISFYDSLEQKELAIKKWQEAEEKTFKNPLIFVKK